MAGLQVFSRDLCPKKGRHISRADLFLSFFNFHGILISVSLPLLIPASVLPDKPAVRCHAVREHDSLCSVGNRIKVIPLSVNQNPARLHTGVDIDIEPVSVNRIKDPSGSQIAICIKCPLVSIDLNPLITLSCRRIAGSGIYCSRCLRITSVCVTEPPACVCLYPVTVAIIQTSVVIL